MKVLVVDDFVTMRELISDVLRRAGYGNVIEAKNGKEALKMLKFHKVDVIISDLKMPEMNGLELLRAVRADSVLKKIPFLMTSATATPKIVNHALKVGADDYLEKPFRVEALVQKVEKILEKKGSAQKYGAN